MAIDSDMSAFTTCRLQQQGKQTLIAVDRPECAASVSIKGGQVLAFIPQGQRPVLWRNNNADYDANETLRQGIPVCWPWFGALIKNPDQVRTQYSLPDTDPEDTPKHGLVSKKEWELVSILEGPHATELVLTTRLMRPDLSLEVRYCFGCELTMQLITENNTSKTVHFSCALHSYFSISAIGSIAVSGTDGIPYYDALQNWEKKHQRGDLTFHGETDRIYVGTPDVIHIKDPLWQRVIAIESDSSHSAVIWNPWTAKSRQLSQFSPEAYQSMVCVETANILEDAIRLEAGKTHSLTVKISSFSELK